jgi:pyruvate carboxylase subunit B
MGDQINKGDVIGYIESMKTYNAIVAEDAGKIMEICLANGDAVDEEDVIIKMQ